MRKRIALLLVLVCVLSMSACRKRSLDYVIKHEAKISGVVREVHDDDILIYIENSGYPNGADCQVSLNVEYKDSVTKFHTGDRVTVYYGEGIMETYPLQIARVYAILLDTPADRSMNEVS